jgi:p38 MAP kinase
VPLSCWHTVLAPPGHRRSTSLTSSANRGAGVDMAEFVRAQIFGTCFEITSRYFGTLRVPPEAGQWPCNADVSAGMSIFSQWEWGHLALYGMRVVRLCSVLIASSAKDELTGQSVAIKKIMKPFSTPVLAKRTYRELKLLKHLRHENVCYCFDRADSVDHQS